VPAIFVVGTVAVDQVSSPVISLFPLTTITSPALHTHPPHPQPCAEWQTVNSRLQLWAVPRLVSTVTMGSRGPCTGWHGRH